MTIPTTRFHKDQADDAYEAYAAMQRAEAKQPSLHGNPYWRALRDTAYARFKGAFEITK